MQESIVLPDPTGTAAYRCWYTMGWSPCALGTATSDDGLAWTKDTGNPVLGQGVGGFAGSAGHTGMIQDPTDPLTLHLFFTDPDEGFPVSPATDLFRATSTDGGLTWGSVVTALDHAGWESGRWGNAAGFIDGDGVWHLLYEAYTTGYVWKMGYATSPDGLTWTRQNSGNPLTTLQRGSGMYGGPDLHALGGGGFELFYHASTSGVLPTSIYRATSADLITWTQDPDPLVTPTLAYEVDQVADPCVLMIGSERWMFYSGVDNPNEGSRINFCVQL